MTSNIPTCCLILVLTSFLCGQTLAIHIKITPEVYDWFKEGGVHISCLQNDKVTTAKEILALEIVKDGKPIVTLRHTSQISFSNGSDASLKAVGQIDTDLSQSYLNLTLESPQKNDLGRYTCMMVYLDEVNIIKTERDSKNITTQKMDIEASLVYLNQKMMSNENQIDNVQKSVVSADTRMSALEKTSQNQSQEISGLTDKVTYQNAFSVTNKEKQIKTQSGKVIILPDVILQIGQGYDVTTGIFTAPRNGLYVFHLVLLNSSKNQVIDMEIKVNDKVLTRLSAIDDNHTDQSSISSVASLKVGDKVSANVSYGYVKIHDSMYSVFSGYLIKAE